MRHFKLQALILILFFLCLVQKAWAIEPRQALEGGLNQVLDLIKSPAYADPKTRSAQREKIAVIVKQNFDFYEFSLRTVGPKWRQFTPAQQKDFSEAFGDLLINTYVNKIDGYNGEQISYAGERSGKDRTEIMTVVAMKGGKKIPVAYRMLPKDGTWKVYDVLVEGISLVKNYRSQFQDILNSSTPEQLIERIRSKANEAKTSHAKS